MEFAVYLPGSVPGGLTARLEREPAIKTMVCAREDEAIGMAAGSFVAGDDHAATVRLALQTLYGQGTSLVLFLPPYLVRA